MKVSLKRLRTSGAVAALAGAGALVAIGSAGATVGGIGSGPPPTTNAPDLRTATITRTVDPSDPAGPQARFCFDAPIASATAGGGLGLYDYEDNRTLLSTAAVVDPQEPTCIVVTFANGADIEQMSVAALTAGPVVGNGGVVAPAAATALQPLSGSQPGLQAIPGRTTAPDLVSAVVSGQKEITYTFDEKLDPTPGAAYSSANFGYYQDSSNGATPTTGTGAVVISRNTAIIQFTNPITSAKQFEVQQGAVQDVDTNAPTNLPSTYGNAGTQIAGSPGLVSATKNADLQTVNLTFSQAVNPGAAAGVIAYRDNGVAVAATAVTTTNDSTNTILKATFPPTLQNDPTEVVRVAVLPTGATARSGTNGVTTTTAAIGTCKCTPGYTNGPDLLSTVIHDDTNTADFSYDEAVEDTPPPAPGSFQLLQPDGTLINGQDGVVISGDQKTVTVHFGSSVSATVGVSNAFGAVTDEGPDHNPAPYSNVGVGAPNECQQGSCPTPSPTVTTTPQPTVTPPPVKNVKTTLGSLKHKKSSTKVTGKVNAAAPCKAGRTVSVVKGGKTIKSGKSKSNGSFSLSSKKAKGAGRNKLTVKVAKRTIGNTICGAASKKV